MKPKIFTGERGSGKTIKLLQTAQKLVNEGYTPVIISANYMLTATLKEKARDMGLSVNKMCFAKNLEDPISSGVGKPNRVLLVDELYYYLQAVSGMPVYGTLGNERIKKIHRRTWARKLRK